MNGPDEEPTAEEIKEAEDFINTGANLTYEEWLRTGG